MIKKILPIAAMIVIVACQQLNDGMLIGKWQAVQLQEEGTPLDIDTNEVVFEFREDRSYAFQSTLNYREAGSYFVEARYLFTTDTINQASTEKAVEIILLSEDSLHLRMQENGKERLLKLVRK